MIGASRNVPRRARTSRKSNRKRGLLSILAVALLLFGLLGLIFFGDAGRLAFGPCTPGREGAGEGASGEARNLLETRNFEASPRATSDLRAGIVDPRLVNTLQTITEEHRVCIDAFKDGHYFLPGVPDGPFIPEGYGQAGGLPNMHYYGRAADIRRVDGKPVRGNGDEENVLDIGEILADIPANQRPDQIIGPPEWTEALGRSSGEGWILEADQLELHQDHLHLGYTSDDGTRNTR